MGVYSSHDPASQDGTFTAGAGSSGTENVSFNRTYRHAVAEVGIAGGAALLGTLEVKFTGWVKDAAGNITGMDVLYDNSDTASHDAVWVVHGVTV